MTFEYFLLNYSTILQSVFLSPETLLSEILQVYSSAGTDQYSDSFKYSELIWIEKKTSVCSDGVQTTTYNSLLCCTQSPLWKMYKPVIPVRKVHPTVNKEGLKLTSEFCDPSFTLGDCSKTDSGRWDSEKKGYIAVAALAKAKAKDKHARMQRTHRKQERVNRLKTAHSFTFLVYRSAQLIIISFKVNTVASLEIWNANNTSCILPDAPLH